MLTSRRGSVPGAPGASGRRRVGERREPVPAGAARAAQHRLRAGQDGGQRPAHAVGRGPCDGPALVVGRDVEVVPEQPRRGARVAQGRVDAVVHDAHGRAARGQRPRAREITARELLRAQARDGVDGRGDPGTPDLGAQEARVERRVVGHEHAPGEQAQERGRDAVERRGERDVRRGDAVHVLRPEVALGVDQGGPLVLDATGGVHEDDRDLGDAVAEAGENPVVSRSTTANPGTRTVCPTSPTSHPVATAFTTADTVV